MLIKFYKKSMKIKYLKYRKKMMMEVMDLAYDSISFSFRFSFALLVLRRSNRRGELQAPSHREVISDLRHC